MFATRTTSEWLESWRALGCRTHRSSTWRGPSPRSRSRGGDFVGPWRLPAGTAGHAHAAARRWRVARRFVADPGDGRGHRRDLRLTLTGRRETRRPSKVSTVVNSSTSRRRRAWCVRRAGSRARRWTRRAWSGARASTSRSASLVAGGDGRHHTAQAPVVRGQQDAPHEGVHRGAAGELVAPEVAVGRRERAEVGAARRASRARRRASRRSRRARETARGRRRAAPRRQRRSSALASGEKGTTPASTWADVVVPRVKVRGARRRSRRAAILHDERRATPDDYHPRARSARRRGSRRARRRRRPGR